MLELGEDLFDRVEIGAVRRQEDQLGAGASDCFAHGLAFVAAQIVEDDDIAGLEGGEQELLDIGEELLTIYGAVEEAGRVDPVTAERGQEGERAPSAVRGLADQALTAWPPAPQGGHVGLGPSLVDEDQAGGVYTRLPCAPLPAPPGHVRAVLLSRERGFF